MDYTQLGIEKKEEQLSSTQPSIERRVGAVTLRVLFAALICLVVVLVCGTVGMVRGIIANAPDVDSINIAPSGYATFIYDAEGNQLQKLTSSDSNRTAVSLDDVPVSLQHAVVAIEDERFYQHSGVDPKGILRAVITGIKNGGRFTEGASTITQQLLKNNVFTTWTKEKTLIDRIKRKFQEQYLAVKLEEKLKNKDLILENYLNTINLGAGTYGVQAASKKYFNKDVKDLTLSESAVLAGITQNPAKYNPITHPEQNAERRKRVLNKMLELGYITEDQMNEALVYTRIQQAQDVEATQNTVYSYFIDELTEQVISDLESQKGYTENQAYQLLYSGGLRIYTTQDPDLQAICDEEVSDESNYPDGTQYSLEWALTVRHSDGTTENFSDETLVTYFQQKMSDSSFSDLFSSEEEGQAYIDEYKADIVGAGDTVVAERTNWTPEPQISLVLMDQTTGYVKAIEGGRGEKTASLTLNRATNVTRQPGSTFKIVSTYAPALESGLVNLGTYIKDEEYSYSNGTPVHNSDGQYRGWITVRQAITNSINVAAVKTITALTPQAAYNQLLKFGFTTLDPAKDVVQPLALGGITNGVTNLELTAAYAAIANGGTYTKPIFYTKILDQDGNTVIDNTAETSRAVSEDTAWLLTSAMQDVVKSGTATECQLDTNMPVAGKTGTTNDYRNVWFVGYTPYYTMGVWAGYDDNSTLPDSGIYRTYHKLIWQKIMSRITENEEIKNFVKPDDIKKMTVCGYSGMLPSSSCPFDSEDYVAGDKIPTKKCNVCKYTDFDASPIELYVPSAGNNSSDESIADKDQQTAAQAKAAYQNDDTDNGGNTAGGNTDFTAGDDTGNGNTADGTDNGGADNTALAGTQDDAAAGNTGGDETGGDEAAGNENDDDGEHDGEHADADQGE